LDAEIIRREIRRRSMLTKATALALVIGLGATPALADGHIVGGAIGAAAGAKSHHAVAGAVVGGAIGHHMAKTKAKKLAKHGN
jgi:hypothetical protein